MSNVLPQVILQTFTDATTTVWDTLTTVSLTHTGTDRAHGATPASISTTIDLSGMLRGWVTLSVSTPLARQAVYELLDGDVESDKEVADGLGELLNMIVGQVHCTLDQALFDFVWSVPKPPEASETHAPNQPDACTTLSFQASDDLVILSLNLETP